MRRSRASATCSKTRPAARAPTQLYALAIQLVARTTATNTRRSTHTHTHQLKSYTCELCIHTGEAPELVQARHFGRAYVVGICNETHTVPHLYKHRLARVANGGGGGGSGAQLAPVAITRCAALIVARALLVIKVGHTSGRLVSCRQRCHTAPPTPTPPTIDEYE